MEKQSSKATILADSIERIGNNRMTTWKLTFPRFILAEILTHAMLKNNSASSRAIPFKKMVESVQNNPFIPIAWQKEHTGMQGTEYFTESEAYWNNDKWLNARDNAIKVATLLTNDKVTKQLCNRLLEPFMWHTIILSGSEFENFFALRAHSMAEIHLQDLAYKMLDAYNASTPKELAPGEWHIPFEDEIDDFKIKVIDYNNTDKERIDFHSVDLDEYKVKIATAKCAQVSYMKFGSDDYEDLLDLHDSLLLRPYEGKRGTRDITDPIHASPASHCAQAMTFSEYTMSYTKTCNDETQNGWCHNLRGFKSYRSMLPNENSKDSRVIKK